MAKKLQAYQCCSRNHPGALINKTKKQTNKVRYALSRCTKAAVCCIAHASTHTHTERKKPNIYIIITTRSKKVGFEKKQSISFFVQITKVAVHFRVRAQMRIDCATRSNKKSACKDDNNNRTKSKTKVVLSSLPSVCQQENMITENKSKLTFEG